MPSSAKKDLYIATTMGKLNEMAELPAKLKTNNAKILVKTADKMLKEAEHSEMLHDEERAYVLFMKYFNVVTFVKKTADYKKEKSYYDNLLGTKNLLASIDKAENLSKSLKERYDLLEAESVAKKLETLDIKKQSEVNKKNEAETSKKVESTTKEENDTKEKENDIKTPKTTPGVITASQLFQLFEDRDAQLLLMDVRSIEDFQETRINHKSIINVPASAIKPGTTVTYIEKALPMDSMSLWKQRGNIDHIIVLDWNSNSDQVKIGSTLQTLSDALFKYDSTVIIKSQPLILDGGYEQWMLQYPTKCVNPSFNKLTKPVVQSSQDGLMDFDYPDFEETIMKPKTEEPPSRSVSSNASIPNISSGSLQSFTGSELGDLRSGSISGVVASLPSIDRSTKPVPDRSTKPGVSNVQTKGQGHSGSNTNKTSSSLYPDVGSISKPVSKNSAFIYADNGAPSVSGFTNADSRASSGGGGGSGFTSAGSRAGVHSRTSSDGKSAGEATTNGTRIGDSNLGSNLTGTSKEIADELKELDRLKKQKEEEIEALTRENERARIEAKLRVERMKEEEKRLSDLEEMKRKQQTDVADLMRMKRSIQDNIVDERTRIEREEKLKTQEEQDRRQELAFLAREEEEKKRRQDEVNKLRQDRKKKDEDRALEDAKQRARLEEENRKQEILAAEERARKLRLADDKKKEDMSRLEIERMKAERLEVERQAALEEKRRQQAENDRLERERRERLRLEKELAERERLEREKKAREAEDKKRADEAKRTADEKLRLLTEAQSKTKILPSSNLKVGWEKKLDPRTNRYFYINHNEGTTQWEAPMAEGEQKSSSSTYTAKLKEEPESPKRGLRRSNSSPNIAKMFEEENKVLPERKLAPSIDRGNKPMKREMPVAMPVKRRDLNPVYGNVGRALTGLRNLGNTCYMNSIIQCLNHTSPLVTYLITNTYLYDINREREFANHAEVVDDFAYVVKALWSGAYRFITPRDFKTVVGRYMPTFQGYEQQDSQEFLTFLLDGLHEGLNKIKHKPKIPEQDNDRLQTHVAAELAWKNHKLHNESVIVELFQGQLKSTLMCLTCKKQSATYEAFMYLTLPIPSSSRCNLRDCLRLFEAEERMEGSSRWKCTQCKCYRDSVKKIEIWKLPPILLIALKRFVYDGYWKTKINTHVDFPVRDMDISAHVRGPQPKSYKLYSVSNHFGTLDGGHYTACCKNPITQKWYKYDDHEVNDTSETNVKSSAAYVLFYTSIDLRPPDFKPTFS